MTDRRAPLSQSGAKLRGRLVVDVDGRRGVDLAQEFVVGGVVGHLLGHREERMDFRRRQRPRDLEETLQLTHAGPIPPVVTHERQPPEARLGS